MLLYVVVLPGARSFSGVGQSVIVVSLNQPSNSRSLQLVFE